MVYSFVNPPVKFLFVINLFIILFLEVNSKSRGFLYVEGGTRRDRGGADAVREAG